MLRNAVDQFAAGLAGSTDEDLAEAEYESDMEDDGDEDEEEEYQQALAEGVADAMSNFITWAIGVGKLPVGTTLDSIVGEYQEHLSATAAKVVE